MMERTAGIVTIGSEILSGKVADDNSPYLCRELRSLGVDVKKLVILPDDEEVIAQQIRSWAGKFHLILVCGGLGPTHDDVTMAGIAKGLGRKIVRHPTLLAIIQNRHTASLNQSVLKLAEVPEGSELVLAEGLRYPVVSVSNIYIFPGIPEILKKKFEALKEKFRVAPFFLKKVFLKSPELEIAHHLSTVNALYSNLKLGSYPVLRHPEYQVMVTLESKDPALLEQAFSQLIARLPQEVIVKTE
jgi:FAD synthetase